MYILFISDADAEGFIPKLVFSIILVILLYYYFMESNNEVSAEVEFEYKGKGQIAPAITKYDHHPQ